jgi:uncharacterized membrane protein
VPTRASLNNEDFDQTDEKAHQIETRSAAFEGRLRSLSAFGTIATRRPERTALIDIPTIDIVAITWFCVSWVIYALIVRRLAGAGRSLSSAMDHQRRQWMRTMLHRELRMIDTGIMSGLQNGTAFFASTSLIALGGCFALLKSSDQVHAVLEDLAISGPARGLFELKAFGLMLIFGFAFFEFGWAYRLFNYASILIGATPTASHAAEPEAVEAVERAAIFTISAGSHFNHGLRAFFFAIGYLGWFVNGWALLVTSTLVVVVQLYRQFASVAARSAIQAAMAHRGSGRGEQRVSPADQPIRQKADPFLGGDIDER